MNISYLRSKDFLRYWLPPLAWCWVALFMSGDLGSADNTGSILEWLLSRFPPLPPTTVDLIHFYVRKTIGHFGNYGCLYFWWFRACRAQLGWASGRAFLMAMAVCLSVASLDEGHQLMLDSRSGSLWDVALDMSGVLTAALVTSIFWTPRNRRQLKNELINPSPGG